jgi:hypothetical protein
MGDRYVASLAMTGYGRQDPVTTGSYAAPEFNGSSSAANL